MKEAREVPRWIDEETLECGNVRLRTFLHDLPAELQSSPSRFVLAKSPQMVDWYRERFQSCPPRTVLEIGIFKGGSVVLYEELWHPEKLVALDIAPERVDALDEYLRRTGAASRVHLYYGIDQADSPALREILEMETEGRSFDLVIDDGCHYLEETRTTFETLFPWIAPGGHYVIEDWAWAHWTGLWQEDGGPWRDRSSLTLLLLELVIVSASRPDLVASVEVDRDLVVVHKGPSAAVGEPMLLAEAALTGGRLYYETLGSSELHGRAPGETPTAALASKPDETSAAVSGLEIVERVNEMQDRLSVLENSRSWRLTAPLRAVSAAIRRRMGT